MQPQTPATDGRPSSAPTMAFALSHEQFSVPQLVEFGVAAEQAGFDRLWTSDHFQPWQANQGHSGFAWITLAALGQRTQRVMMGTGVTCPSFRYRPALVAQAFATLSQLTPGRVYLGLGAGEKLNEAAAGGGWGDYRERSQRLAQAVQIIRQLWSGQPVRFESSYFQVDGRLYDPPAQPIPIYIAASGPKSARLAGEYGDGLIADLPALKQDPAYKAAFFEGARAAGKNPETMPILVEHFVIVGGEEEARYGANLWRFHPKGWESGYFNNISPVDIQRRAEAEIPLEQAYQSWVVSTDPSAHLKAIQDLIGLGATHITIHSAQQDQQRAIAFYGQHILPQVRGGSLTSPPACNAG